LEAADGDLLTEFRSSLLDEFIDSLRRVLDVVLRGERLLVHHLINAALDNLRADSLRLGQEVLLLHFDSAFALNHLLVGIRRVHVLDIRARGDLHRNVGGERLESVTASDKVGFAVDFNEHTNAGTGVDVRRDGTFGGDAARLLVGRRHTLLAQECGSFLDVVVVFGERLFAIHHTGASGVAELLDELGINLDGIRGRGSFFLLLHLGSSRRLSLDLSLRSDFSGEIVDALFNTFAEVESLEAADGDLLTEFRSSLLDEFIDSLRRVLDVVLRGERLLVHHLINAALDNLRADSLRLGQEVLLLHFDSAFALNHLLVGIRRVHVLDIRARGDLHRNVGGERLESVTASDKVGFAVDFNEHTNAGTGVDVRRDGTFGGDAARLLVGRRHTLLAQECGSFLDVVVVFGERLFAIHHTGASGVAELLDESGGDATSGGGSLWLLSSRGSRSGGRGSGGGSGGSSLLRGLRKEKSVSVQSQKK